MPVLFLNNEEGLRRRRLETDVGIRYSYANNKSIDSFFIHVVVGCMVVSIGSLLENS